MRFVFDNLLDDLESTDMAASTEDSSYPLTNVIDQRLTKQWRTENATTHTAIFDLGATAACTVIAILGHNLSTSGTVTVIGNDDIASGLTWVTSGQSSTQTITYNADVMLSFITSLSHRYWKFTFSGQSQNGIQVGRLWLGTYLQVSPASLDDFSVNVKRDDIVVYGRNRQKYASIGGKWREFNLTFPKTGTTAMSSIMDFYDTVGRHSSFIFCNFDTSRSYELVDPCYVSIQDDIGFSHRGHQQYTYSLSLSEDK